MEDKLHWENLSKVFKFLYVRILREDAHTDEAIAEFLGTTKNAIVGFRHRYLHDLTGTVEATKKNVDPARFTALLAEAVQGPPSPPPSQFLCAWPLADGTPCGKPCETKGSRLCDEHRKLAFRRG